MNKILFLQYPKCSTCQKAAKWLKENNIEAFEKTTGSKIDRVANETTLPMSQKRLEKYSTK